MIDAQQKKPKVPVHAVMTARQPMVRFIGGDDMAHNRELFRVWLQTGEVASVGDPVVVPAYPGHCFRPGAGGYPVGDLRCLRRQEMRRRFRSNLLFLISCYHIRSHLPELKGVFVWSARCMPF